LLPYGDGVPQLLKQLIHTVPLNDANRLEDTLKQHGADIGAFLIEPIMGNCCSIEATRQYVHDARALCDRYGVVMIIDEVKTGFRVARGGVQELLDVKADLCTFAKAVANGYPLSVLAGREDIMRAIGDGVAHGGTYTAHAISMAAAETTLQILDETDALETIADYGQRLRHGMGEILAARDIPHCFSGHPSMSGLFFADEPPSNYRDWKNSDYTFYDTMAPTLHDLGIICEPDSREPWFMSEAHDDACLDETLEIFEMAVDRTIENLDQRTGASK
jgi:glutamate-1-semialdehyde 2,1-aminomutase